MVQNDEEYESKVRVLDTIEITTEVENTSSGIDVYKRTICSISKWY